MVLCDPTPVERLQSRRLVAMSTGARRWPEGRITSLQLNAEAQVFGGGRLRVRVDISGHSEAMSLWIRLGGQRFELPLEDGRSDSELELPEVQWWWPRGYGAQLRYPVLVSLVAPDGHVVDAEHRQVGFRWVQWLEPEVAGGPGVLVVNGAPVRVRGVSWRTASGGSELDGLEQLAAANANLLRIAGCRDDAFYDRCDELGLLAWQDLPDGDAGQFRRGAPLDLARVAHHPSVVLLTGADAERIVADVAPQVSYRPIAPVASHQWRPSAPTPADDGELRTQLTRQRGGSHWWAGVLVDCPGDPDDEFCEVLRDAYADRALTLQPTADGLVATVVNDTATRLSGRLRLRLLSTAGVVIAAGEEDVEVAARRNGVIPVPEHIAAADGSGGFVEAELAGLRDQCALASVPTSRRPVRTSAG